MKTTSVNGIPRIQAPLRRLGRSSETDKWRYKVLPDIIQQSWERLVKRLQHFDSVNLSKDVLSQTHVNRKCTFCILGQYSAEQKCTVSIMSQVITLMPMVGKDVRNFALAVNEC